MGAPNIDNRIPQGFEPINSLSPFNTLVGPLYVKRTGEAVALGLLVEEKHRNNRAIVHGGMICTLVDYSMSYAAGIARNPPLQVITASMSVDFAGNARVGDWIEARVDLQRTGRRVVFANCFVWNGEERIARASGIFLIMPSGV